MSRHARLSLAVILGTLLALVLPARDCLPQDQSTPDGKVAAALKLWQSAEPKARLDGLRRLGRLGPRAAPAVPALIAGLSDREARIRKETADVLQRIGPSAKPAVPALVTALNDPDSEVRSAAAWALQAAKPDPKAVIPALVAHLRAEPDRRCPVVVYVLGDLGEPAVPALIDLLKDDNETVRRMAGYALSRIGPAARSSVPALIQALRLPDRLTREDIAQALAGAGPEAVEPLIRALNDRDPKVRGGAARALEILRTVAKAAVPALIAALADFEPPDDPNASREPSFDWWEREGEPQPTGYYASLRAIGPAAVPALMERLDAPDHQARVLALRALGFLGDDAKPAVPRLIELLRDPALRGEAASALGGIGARDAVPALVAGLNDPDQAFRARAAETLGRIGWSRQGAQYSSRTVARGAIRPLAATLKDSDSGVRAAAARALRDIGPEASVVIPELVAALGDPVPDVRLATVRAFGRVGFVPAESRGVVIALLNDPDPRVREAAAGAIDEDALKTAVAMAGLLAALKDSEANVRAAAAQTLRRARKVGYSSDGEVVFDSPGLLQKPAALASLQAALGDPDSRVRASVAWLLPVFKEEAATSVPLLTARLKDPEPVVRRAAGEALSRFGPAAKDAASTLLEALADPDENFCNDENVSAKAAKALEAIGPTAKAAMIDRLTGQLGNPDKSVRSRVSWALQMLGDKVGPALFRLLADPKTPRPVKVEVLGVLAGDRGAGVITSFGKQERPGPEAPDAIPALRELARDEDEKVRTNARKLLFAVEPSGEAAARLLLEAARVEDPEKWDIDQAMEALEPAAVGVLIEGLKDPDEEVRTAAAYALAAIAEKLPRAVEEGGGEMPEQAEAEARARGLRLLSQAVDALIPALKDTDTQVRWAAAWAIYSLGTGEKAVPALIEVAEDRTTRVRPGATIRLASVLGGGNGNRSERSANGELLRVGAIQALGAFGESAAPAVPALIDALRDDDRLTRWFAAAVLAEIGPKAKAAVHELINILQSKDEVPAAPSSMGFGGMERPPDRLAVVAAKALGKIGPDAHEAVAALNEALADPDESLRGEAAEALGGIGADAVAAVPALVRALGDPGWSVGDIAAQALGQVGPAAVPALIEALHRSSPDVRRRAMTSLGVVGPKAAAALPDLIRALSDPDEEIRTAAAEAAGLVGNGPDAAAAVTGLIAALKDTDRLVRKNVAEALVKIGPTDKRVFAALASTIHDADPEVRSSAADALATIGMPAFSTLRSLLRDDNEDVRYDATMALARMGEPGYAQRLDENEVQGRARVQAPRAALLSALRDPDERIREGAGRALGEIGSEMVPDLVAALRDPSPAVRLHASRSLGFMGADARRALDTLRTLLDDPDPEVRRSATTAIEAIRKSDP